MIEVTKDQLLDALKESKDVRVMLDCIDNILSMLPSDVYRMYITEQYINNVHSGVYYKLSRVSLAETYYFVTRDDAFNFLRRNNLDTNFVLTSSIFDDRCLRHKPICGYYVEKLRKDQGIYPSLS